MLVAQEEVETVRALDTLGNPSAFSLTSLLLLILLLNVGSHDAEFSLETTETGVLFEFCTHALISLF